ncbi:biopolymer transporter ExbD [Aquimarina sp. MMG016]|uniref:ExbD/TolR family protein n=1 Tax=Aquimarina sp. MMG016 TaxID=2822690 RepID=UPI001B3A422C|nr:biopolymer transporter ExbD [Aquimarina sp. MMG016]MBQ4818762.1 biopolymer transporter ExbD [Aquimarina sp. MMG016]
MSKFRKKQKVALPEISTASLPDIVFMLLFFFMVATIMRKDILMVENKLPMADQIEKLEKRDLIMNIYVGKPSSRYLGTEGRIQLNDKFAKLEDIKPFILSEIASKRDGVKPFLITSLKVDKKTKMGLVNDIKKELREVDALKINYATIQGGTTNNIP